MTAKKVVTHTRRQKTATAKDFLFSAENIPRELYDNRVPDFVRKYYQQAWDVFTRLPIPDIKQEAWRRTDLSDFEADAFQIFDTDPSVKSTTQVPQKLLEPLVGDQHGGQIVFTPTDIRFAIDPEISRKGVVFTDLVSAWKQHPNLLERILGKIVRADEGKFSALAAALAKYGIFIYVPPGVQVEQPLHSILWEPGVGIAYPNHILIYVDDDASLTFLHESTSPDEKSGQTLNAGITEIHVGRNANLRFVELQTLGEHFWNFSYERARVERDGNLDWIFGAIGSRLTKSFADIDLVGAGASGRMSGFYFTDGSQHLDHDTQQNHLAPDTTSDLLFKGALKDRSRSVWQGMIYVAPGAQKTDGYQANRNLLLSKQARADSIPGLEILADDVRCTHGATVGKVDEDQIFYLRSRGIPYDQAERLIVEGFFDPIMQRIPYEGVRSRFQDAINEKMG
jgi:Fe-S cluster assembly protein SufD